VKVAIHQPDLLPYSGFWFKMATSDVFVVAVHDQFQKHGYQRRVMMRDSWCSHQLVGKPSLVPIDSIEVAPGWQSRIVNVIRGRYARARHFPTRGEELVARIEAASGTRLDEVNLAMIRILCDLLGIDTELVITDPPQGAGIDRLIEEVAMVGGTSYLSGAGGAAYLGEDATERFRHHGIELLWSTHEMSTGDSIVSVLMDEEDPMEVVLRGRA
jgi:WbqC-like protein family